jgi:NaMN:DMB phosphoribosyltransferase
MIENCLLIHQNNLLGFENWQKFSPVELNYVDLAEINEEFIDKKIDEGISAFAISPVDNSTFALAIVGVYLNLDAATLLGSAEAGTDEIWIQQCGELRDQIKKLRNFKTDKAKLIQELGLVSVNKIYRIFEIAVNRETKVFLLGDLALALAFLLNRENSKAKHYLIPASESEYPGIKKAIEVANLSTIALPPNSTSAKTLALSLLSHM